MLTTAGKIVLGIGLALLAIGLIVTFYALNMKSRNVLFDDDSRIDPALLATIGILMIFMGGIMAIMGGNAKVEDKKE